MRSSFASGETRENVEVMLPGLPGITTNFGLCRAGSDIFVRRNKERYVRSPVRDIEGHFNTNNL